MTTKRMSAFTDAEIRKAIEAASPAPWGVDAAALIDFGFYVTAPYPNDSDSVGWNVIGAMCEHADAYFCYVARETIPELLAELERTREALHDLVVASARWVARGTPLVGDVDPMALDEYQCCGFDYAGQHGVDCPYVATQNAIVQAKAILPRTAQQEESRDG